MGMIIEDVGGGPVGKGFPAGWTVVAKPCDICKSAGALLFCRADSAFMCLACDSRVHATNNKLTSSRHERVWMCEVCEQAPASVTCKADAAALCVTCDCDIHSANPLAQRHERIPVVPFYETAELVVKSMAMATPNFQVQDTKINSCPGHGNNYTTDHSWISSNTINNSKFNAEETPDLKSSMEFLLLSGADPFLDFDYPVSSLENHYNSGSDSVVPVQTMKPPPPPMPTRLVVDNSSETRFEIDFARSSINSYNNNSNSYAAQSLSHSVSSSSLDVGVVPDGSCISETSYPFGNLSGTASGNQAFASQLAGKDREARVLRYREKRKNRKFEKTIRYASRKAYAETRPRVKGRFAKRSSSSSTDIECEIDQIFSSDSNGFCFSEARYGVVPSF